MTLVTCQASRKRKAASGRAGDGQHPPVFKVRPVADNDERGDRKDDAFDTVGKADMATGKTTEITPPALKDEMARLPEAKRAFYENFADRTNGS